MPGFRSKYVAGNICLLLFVAFLAMTAVGIVETGKASADVGFTHQAIASGYTTTLFDSQLLSTWPLTSAEDSTAFTYYFRLFSGSLGDANPRTANVTPSFGAKQAGATVYSRLLDLVYSVPPEWNLRQDGTVAYERVYTVTAQNAVYVDLLYRPPAERGRAGAVAAPEQQTISTEYGTIVLLPALGSATYNVNESLAVSALRALAAGIGQFTIADLSATIASEKATVIGSGILRAALDLAKDLVVDSGQVVITLPNGFIDPAIVAQAGAGAAFRVMIGIMGDTASVQLIRGTHAAGQGFVPQSTVFSLDAALVLGAQTVGDVSRFDKPVNVTFRYNPQPGIDESKLGVYGLDPVTHQWVYAGGKVNEEANQITAGLEHFSQYCVMLYDKTFADIATHWAKTDVELMASRHVVKGVSDTRFAPETPVTRAQFAALLLRALGLKEQKPAMETFLDVSRDSWYFGAVEGAFKAGIIKGYEDGAFKPDARVSRQEMATMLVRAIAKAGVNTSVTAADVEALSRFADRNRIAEWAAEAAAYAARTGILTGRTPAEFAPLGTGTRAEAAVMMKRLMATTDRI